MVKRCLAVGLALLVPGLAVASPPPPPPHEPGAACLSAVADAERAGGLPARLLHSIALVESGRTDPVTGRRVPWPWTINAAGTGHYFESREAAVAAVRRLQASGIRSIDVGCAQVNLQHHPAAFATLEDAFDPQANAAYAARFLNSLYRTAGSWPAAAAGYHSMTPGIGRAYAEKVMAGWPDGARHGRPPASGRGASGPTMALSILTPAFAAVTRRIDEDLARGARLRVHPGGVGMNRPPVPAPNMPVGTRRMARRGASSASG